MPNLLEQGSAVHRGLEMQLAGLIRDQSKIPEVEIRGDVMIRKEMHESLTKQSDLPQDVVTDGKFTYRAGPPCEGCRDPENHPHAFDCVTGHKLDCSRRRD